MLTPKTPGVYIQEIPSLPASIAPVATAIPAFVGYTEKAVMNDETLANNTPVRIQSLLEYRQIFGTAFDELFGVTIDENTADPANPDITISPATTAGLSPYLLYYQLEMFYANGGGPCYIVSVGTYNETDPAPSDISNTALAAGLAALEKEDEPTILVVPEAVHLTAALRKGIYDNMLAQAAKLQDRVALMDVIVDTTQTIKADSDDFRNDDVGPDNLKYGMAYYPSLKTSLERYYSDGSVVIEDTRPGGTYDDCTLNVLNNSSDFAIAKIIISDHNVIPVPSTFTINTGGANNFELVASPSNPNDFEIGAGNATTAQNLEDVLNANPNPAYTVTRSSNVILITATQPGSSTITVTIPGVGVSMFPSSGTMGRIEPDTTLYTRIKKEIKKMTTLTLYPCGAMAGVYARVDRDRGVWKAPANVSLRSVREPVKMITSVEQRDLNIDATSGKSINAIRTFSGKGVMVWGARTLAGNDNEWRYVPVRRFYNFAEESIKKATEFVVFEPNDAKTWVRVKGMIENFLTKLWRDGALAGAKPEHAFFVKVGLGETMTAQDILEGIMNVEIGMAVVRPAEFIILKFSHKLQES